MKVELTIPQIRALIGAGVEVQAGTGQGWLTGEWKALSHAIERLKNARDGVTRERKAGAGETK